MKTAMREQHHNERKKREREGKVWEYVATVWSYLLITFFTFLFFWVEVILFVVLFPFDRTRYCVGRLFRYSSVLSTKWNPLWDFRVVGPLPVTSPAHTVFVSNHLSLADSALISYLPWEMKWLGKSSLFWIPFIGWSMWLAGDVKLHRGDRASAKGAMQACKSWLQCGANVMIFPEGTRSRTGTMGDFKDGAFRLAIETGSDVFPLAVTGTDNCIPVHSWKMGRAKGVVSVGTPISTKGMTLNDIEKLKSQTRKQIEEMVEKNKAFL